MTWIRDRLRAARKHPYSVTFAATLFMLLIYSVIQGIYPFGEYTFLRKDLYHQYLPFLAELRRRLLTGQSLKYSFRLGIGASFYALYVYYLTDPLNLLSVVIPEEYLLEYMTFIAYIKMSLGASFMCRYLRYRGRNERTVYAVMLGICYGLSGFLAAYDWNVMWLWGIALAPLVLMGAEKIADGERAVLYTLTMTLTVMSNYYIAMVTGIFLIPYFLTLCFDNFRGIRNTLVSWLKLFFSTLLAGGRSAFRLVPGAWAIMQTSFAGGDFPDGLEFYMSIPTLMMRSLAAAGVETGLSHEPNIYASVVVLSFAALFFAGKKFSLEQKITRALLLVLFYFSFNTDLLEYIWHGMNYPDSLPARQGFLFVTVLLITAYDGLDGAGRLGGLRLGIAAFIPAVFLVTAIVFCRDDSHVTDHMWIINTVFIILYLGFFVFRVFFRKGYTRRGVYVLCMILMAELLLNFNITSERNVSREGYFAHKQSFAALRDMAESENRLNQGHFTRFDAVDERIRNDACLTGYNGDAFFSSTLSEAAEDFYGSFGMKSSRVHCMATGLTPFTQALLGIDYVLADEFRNNETDYDVAFYTAEYEDDYLYRSMYTLPFGYTVPCGIYDPADVAMAADPVKRQNIVALRLAGEPVFEEAEITEASYGKGRAEFTVSCDGHYYAYITGEADEIKEYTSRSDEAWGVFDEMKYRSIMDLGRLESGDRVRLESEGDGEDEWDGESDIGIYRFIPENMVRVEEALGNTSLTLTEFEDDRIEGIIDLPKGRSLVLAMPYDEGWEVVADGYEKVEPERFYGYLMKLDLTPGLHQISLVYHIPYLIPGIIISAVSLVAAVIAILAGRHIEPE